ncbi:MAG TPA: NADH-quinone oxidoreductase subunit A [Candidatus Wallbacteria bacterium]|nr:NADH-quinone oxidoreductase subunit A [Candidatus Wallbacteria bacterium]
MQSSISYIPLLMTMVFACAVPFILIAADYLLGPKRPDARKQTTYECGFTFEEYEDTYSDRLYVRFIVVAMLFILFDVEAIFLFPWAVSFKEFGLEGFIEMLFFAAVLLLGLYYAAKKGVFEWD